jgi:hypothetical protein
MPRWLALALSIALTMCACDAEPEPTVASPLEFTLRVDSLWCEKYVECGGRAPVEACREWLWLDRRFDRFPVDGQQVASGRVRFHGERAAACLRAIEAASCPAAIGFEWIDQLEPECLTVFEPAQERGQPCDDALYGLPECRHGLECKLATCDADQCCSGTCELPSDEPEDAFPLRQEGEACTSPNDCDWHLACGAGGTCQVPRAVGDPCTLYCAGENVCRDGTCAAPTVLDRVTTCDGGTSDTSICDAQHYCGTDGKCWAFALPTHACGPGIGVCDWFYECNPDSHTCELKRETGEACTRSSQCQGKGSTCTQGVCTPPHANGESCSVDADCMSRKCDAGTCRDRNLCDTTF